MKVSGQNNYFNVEKLLLVLLVFSIPWRLSAQTSNPITGRVTDDSTQAPLTGVSVTIKNGSGGVSTDADGKFSINAALNSVLLFSMIGYEPLETTADKEVISVQLKKETKSMDAVVVVGYGTQTKRNVTGSIVKVDLKQTENLPTNNPGQALRGRVAGVQFTENGRPGQGGTILIRGQRSISANNNPLVVLDGIIFEGSLSDITPSDIESMEILKDAAATAIYGARAANGVILISSKKGISEKPVIRVNSYYGISGWSYKPKVMDADGYIQKLLEFRRQNGLEAIDDPQKIAGYLQPTEAKNYLAGKSIKPWDVLSQDGGVQNLDVSVSGRSNKTNYFISGSYNNEKGIVFNDNAKRISTRINLDNQITSWLKIGINAQYTERDLSGEEGDVDFAFRASPYGSVWLDDAGTDPNPFPTEETLNRSIIFNALTNQNQELYKNLFANIYGVVDIPFVKGLSYRINYSPNKRWYNLNTFVPIYQRNTLNNLGNASRRVDFNRSYVLENIVTYNKKINNNHAFDVTLLYGRNQSYNESVIATGADFTGSSGANGWNNLSLAKIQTNTSSADQVDAISSMARVNYRLKSRYIVTLTARRDGNSVFGEKNKYGVFPSVGLAWIASDESFLKNIEAIRTLKIRASYGSVGNQAISAYQSLTRQGQNQYVFGDGGSTSTGIFPTNLANSNLGWETTTTANIAADFELFDGRIGGTVEFYNMDTRDLLLTRQLPTPTGFPSIFTNVGATNNKGLELSLNTVNIRSKKFEWSSNLAFSTNKNKIEHLYRSDVNGDGKEDNDIGNGWFIGQPISVAYDYRVIGVYQEGETIPVGQKPGFMKMEDTNGDKVIDPNDRVILGTLQPKYRFGLSNNFRYGNFNLMVMLSAMTGWIANNSRLSLDNASGSNGNYPGRDNILDAGWWTPENKSNTRPSLAYTNPYNHGYYESRNFLRIQEASLAYEFPVALVQRLKMNSFRAYLSGRNLYTFTNWQSMDPETGYANRSGLYPSSRTVSLGINVSF
ncbi:SusC/RagA family TonB-linked outer membrane protein [Flavitalea sp.]|nr:TonB-dependent receptor [Flavitalea sp.]